MSHPPGRCVTADIPDFRPRDVADLAAEHHGLVTIDRAEVSRPLRLHGRRLVPGRPPGPPRPCRQPPPAPSPPAPSAPSPPDGPGELMSHPSSVPLPEVCSLWSDFDALERLASGAKCRLAARVAQSRTWQDRGERSAAEWMAHASGRG
jgi:hypothetical protein